MFYSSHVVSTTRLIYIVKDPGSKPMRVNERQINGFGFKISFFKVALGCFREPKIGPIRSPGNTSIFLRKGSLYICFILQTFVTIHVDII
jgi:hypothetical protein